MNLHLAEFTTSWVFLVLGLVLWALSRAIPLLRRSSRLLLVTCLVQVFRDAAAAGLITVSYHLLKAADSVFIFLLVAISIYLIRDLTQAWLARRGVSITRLVWDLSIGVAYAILFLLLLKEIFNIDITPVLATSAVLTVVIGLAVQDTLINLIAGTVFHFEDSLRPGDWIQVDDTIGQVKELTWRSVQLLTTDNELVVVPNQDFTKKRFQNLTRHNAVRTLTIGTSYADDPDLVMQVLKQAVLSTPGVLWQPEPVVYIVKFNDFSIDYRVRFHIESYTGYRRLEGAVLRAIWYNFQRHHITIPFPIRTLQIERRPPESANAGNGERVREALAQVDMFRILNGEEMAAVAAGAEIVEYPAGAVVALDGDVGRSMFVILRGSVDIQKDGKKVAALGQHELFGEIALFTGEPRGATVIAAEPLQVLVIEKDGFDAILKRNEGFIAKIEQMVEERLRATAGAGTDDAKSDVKRSILGRIRKYLLG
ncbi:MAG TPA: mechanosensitive ion channel family protein [Acidobacteriota bacterium]|nr:mechanosensitive ion channel family protein [Acidobacteriota bacterium]HQM64936.1 mechanosensitive ion channel family protein [Acidobacteriota bacterium]